MRWVKPEPRLIVEQSHVLLISVLMILVPNSLCFEVPPEALSS